MLQLAFLALALIGLVPSIDFVFAEATDPLTVLHGRLGALALVVGVAGLIWCGLSS
jgi:hypothetical protein